MDLGRLGGTVLDGIAEQVLEKLNDVVFTATEVGGCLLYTSDAADE